MCYEDIPRVAQFKTRAARSDRIREEVKADPGQHLHVTEFFRPRVEELCALLPPGLARAILDSAICRRFLNLFTGGKRLRTDTVGMFVLLRLLAGLRRWRRNGLGYRHEHAMIRRWLQAVKAAASLDQALAREISECGGMVKGYGATRQRTTTQLLAILEQAERADSPAASAIALWRQAALADDEGAAFSASLERPQAA
jgi:indolepyruvate ferredoxin oxidoreductase beta subunit